MNKALKQKNQESDVRVIDGSLVLSFPHATEPVVWRMNLAQAKEAGFEIREAKGKFLLVQKSGSDVNDIASFSTREAAVDALMQVSSALAGRPAAKDIRMAVNERAQWVVAIVGVLAVVSLFFYLSRVTPVENTLDASPAAGTAQTAAPADPQTSTGVPVSADDFLRGQ